MLLTGLNPQLCGHALPSRTGVFTVASARHMGRLQGANDPEFYSNFDHDVGRVTVVFVVLLATVNLWAEVMSHQLHTQQPPCKSVCCSARVSVGLLMCKSQLGVVASRHVKVYEYCSDLCRS